MAHHPPALKVILSAAAPPDMPLVFRSMFGGILAYVEGKPLASLSDIGLALKCVGATHAALLALPGAARLRYEPGQPESKSYVVVPEAMLADAGALREWVVRCAGELASSFGKATKGGSAGL